MYKNANIQVKEKRISEKFNQHRVTLARMKQDIRHIGSVVNVLPPRGVQLDEVIISKPPNLGLEALQILSAMDPEEQLKTGMHTQRVENLLEKVREAEESSTPLWEKKLFSSKGIARKDKRQVASVRTNVEMLEKKLAQAIKVFYRVDVATLGENKPLSTRILLPYYKMADVKHFLDAFQKVDEDYSGDLNIDEWCNFLMSLGGKSLDIQQARTIFYGIDMQGDGVVSVKDLIPVVFGKATSNQQKLITKYLELEISRRKAIGKDILTEHDLRKLFEYYDEDVLGFIPADAVRERIKALSISEQAMYAVLSSFAEMDADEMMNPSDFIKTFHLYVLE
jgi:Ca2+-binding EF-hand superfamily protein